MPDDLSDKPQPNIDVSGVPHCAKEDCSLFDGKRCRATGFRPSSFCEPAITEMAATIAAFRVQPVEDREAACRQAEGSRDAEWQERLAPLHDGYTGDGCDSGDPIDWSVAALRMVRNAMEDALDEARLAVASLTSDHAAMGKAYFDVVDAIAAETNGPADAVFKVREMRRTIDRQSRVSAAVRAARAEYDAPDGTPATFIDALDTALKEGL